MYHSFSHVPVSSNSIEASLVSRRVTRKAESRKASKIKTYTFPANIYMCKVNNTTTRKKLHC